MTERKFIDITYAEEETPVLLNDGSEGFKAVHIFNKKMIHAVNAALASGRPLLVRGEPGVGKSQLAYAAAVVLKRQFLQFTVDIQSEAQDLMWHFDAVRRLAEAQVMSARSAVPEDIDDLLNENLFLYPGPLWWAFDWKNAQVQADKCGVPVPELTPDADPVSNGCVLLIDEIDKAETDVPNGLLEALGAQQFSPMNKLKTVKAQKPLPLVIITTNEERALPNAFLRRCMVLHLELPDNEQEFIELLTKRAHEHFPEISRDIQVDAAKQLYADRQVAHSKRLTPLPGQAEFLDLLRALYAQEPTDEIRQKELLEQISQYALRKHLEMV